MTPEGWQTRGVAPIMNCLLSDERHAELSKHLRFRGQLHVVISQPCKNPDYSSIIYATLSYNAFISSSAACDTRRVANSRRGPHHQLPPLRWKTRGAVETSPLPRPAPCSPWHLGAHTDASLGVWRCCHPAPTIPEPEPGVWLVYLCFPWKVS